MAITFDSKTAYAYDAGVASSWTFSHLVPRGAVSTLVLCVDLLTSSMSTTCSTVTFGGVSLTKAVEATPVAQDGDDLNFYRSSIWYLSSPAVGTGSIVVTASASSMGIVTVALNYKGVSRTSPVRASNSAFSDTGYANPPGTNLETMSVGVTSAVGDLVLGNTCFYAASTPPYDLGTGETERQLMNANGTTSSRLLVLEKAGASGTVTLSDTINTPDVSDYGWSFTIVSLAPDTYAPAFSYKTAFTIAAAQVPSTQSDFPALIKPTDARFKTIANGGNVANSSGFDIRVYSDAALTTELPFELVTGTYNATTGTFEIWVKINAANGLTVYIAYGDANLNYNYNDSSAVFSNAFVGVWHFGDGTTLSAVNAVTLVAGTINGPVAASTTGPWGVGAGDWGTNAADAIVTDITSHATQRTYSMWCYYRTAGGGSGGRVFEKRTSGAQVLLFNLMNSFNVQWSGGNAVWAHARASSNAWHLFQITYDAGAAANDPITWTDGAVTTYTTDTNSSGTLTTNTDAFIIGNRLNDSARNWDGKMDEFRIADTIRSSDWKTTEYNNQFAPTTFWGMGAQTIAGPEAGYLLNYHR